MGHLCKATSRRLKTGKYSSSEVLDIVFRRLSIVADALRGVVNLNGLAWCIHGWDLEHKPSLDRSEAI